MRYVKETGTRTDFHEISDSNNIDDPILREKFDAITDKVSDKTVNLSGEYPLARFKKYLAKTFPNR